MTEQGLSTVLLICPFLLSPNDLPLRNFALSPFADDRSPTNMLWFDSNMARFNRDHQQSCTDFNQDMEFYWPISVKTQSFIEHSMIERVLPGPIPTVQRWNVNLVFDMKRYTSESYAPRWPDTNIKWIPTLSSLPPLWRKPSYPKYLFTQPAFEKGTCVATITI